MMFSKGNKKLPRDYLIFNLPAVSTCPGVSRGMCETLCYAKREEGRYKEARMKREQNYVSSLSSRFIGYATHEIKGAKGIKAVRIHSSGDFYSQGYLDKWIEIAKVFKGIRFLAYTKSIELDFSRRGENFRVISSLPGEKEAFPLDGLALVVNKGARLKSFVSCPGSCRSCSYCYSPKVAYPKVTFAQH